MLDEQEMNIFSQKGIRRHNSPIQGFLTYSSPMLISSVAVRSNAIGSPKIMISLNEADFAASFAAAPARQQQFSCYYSGNMIQAASTGHPWG